MRRLPSIPLVSLVFLTALTALSQGPPRPSIDELRSLPYVAPPPGAEVRTGVVTNSRFAGPGYNFYADRFANKAALFTNEGTILHEWSRPNSSSWGHVEPLPDGSVLAIESWDEAKRKEFPEAVPFPSRIVKLSPSSELLWTSSVPAHHDIQLLARGELLTLTERPKKIRAVSRTHRTIDNGIARLDAKGKVLREMSLYEIVSRSPDVRIKPVKPDFRGLIDLFHANSVQRFGELPWIGTLRGAIFDPRNILFCSRHQDLVGIVSPEGRLLWSWGQNDLGGPHAARLLPNGRILIFDNGLGREASRIVEVDPLSDRISWTYQAERPNTFYSATGGYVQRLPNGNTLITDSWTFSAFEVTPEPRVVWRFVSPGKSFVYRVHRYGAEYFAPGFRRLFR